MKICMINWGVALKTLYDVLILWLNHWYVKMVADLTRKWDFWSRKKLKSYFLKHWSSTKKIWFNLDNFYVHEKKKINLFFFRRSNYLVVSIKDTCCLHFVAVHHHDVVETLKHFVTQKFQLLFAFICNTKLKQQHRKNNSNSLKIYFLSCWLSSSHRYNQSARNK